MKIENLEKLNTFEERVKYCDDNFNYLGTGTHRKVYELDKNKVLKVCFNQGGINQCMFEKQMPFSSLFIKTFYYGCSFTYIIQEKAELFNEEKFKTITGIDFLEYRKAIRYLNKLKIYNSCEKFEVHKNNSKDLNYIIFSFRYNKLVETFKNNNFYKEVLNLTNLYGNWLYGLSKKSSIGSVLRNEKEEIVFIDYGLSRNDFTVPYSIKI